MKVLLLTSSMNSGGAERVASTLANAWVARGDEVTLMPTFSGKDNCFYALSPMVRFVWLSDLVKSQSKSLFNQMNRLYVLRQFFIDEKPDVIVSFLSNVNVAAVLASLGLKTPLVVCERIDPFVMPTSWALKLACRILYQYADMLMVQTDAVMQKYLNSGMKLPKICVIHNPIPEKILNVKKNTVSGEYNDLLAVGRLADQKQFDKLITVFATLAPRHLNWRLKIVGEGPLKDSLQQQINALGLSERIQLTGLVADISQELIKADIFVMTSSVEGFPNALLEAMGVGLPCIIFDCPCGPRELSNDGEAAILVPLNDMKEMALGLERLMRDKALRLELGLKARETVIERFSLEAILRQWDSLFEAVGVQI